MPQTAAPMPAPAGAEDLEARLRAVRTRLVDTALIAIAIACWPALAVSMYRASDIGWHNVMYGHLAATVLCNLCAVFHKRLPRWVRAGAILALPFLVGVAGTWFFGLIGMGIPLFAIWSVHSTLLFGGRIGAGALGASVAVAVGIGAAASLGWLAFDFDFNVYATSLSAWATNVMGLGVLTGVAAGAATRLHRTLIDTIRSLGRRGQELQQANAALQASEQRFRTLVANVPAAVYRCGCDPPWTVRYVSEPVREITGYPPSDFLGSRARTYASVIHPDDHAAVDRAVREALAERRPYGLEYRLVDRDGEVRWVYDRGRAHFGDNGEPLWLEGVLLETTARKQAEQALRDSEKLYREAIEAAAGVPYSKDLRVGRFHFIGARCRELLGVSAEDFLKPGGVPYTREKVITEPGAPADLAEYHRQFDDGLRDRYMVDSRLVLPDGQERWIADRAVAVRDDATGQVVGSLGILLDITDRKRAEDERHRLEAQLHRAQKMEAVGLLAGGIAHDFNNLLQAILGYTELARRETPPEHPAQESLRRALEASARARDLTGQLLAFSRREPPRPDRLDLNELVTRLMRMAGRVIGEHIELCLAPDPDEPAAWADRGQIEQVLMNLCLNARDAMPDGGRLTIETGAGELDAEDCRTCPWARPGRYVFLSVADTGHGIPTDIQDRIFEPFFTTKQPANGTGLGLASAYAIVKRHRGIIRFDSRPGRGASFRVHLPAAGAVAAEARRRTPAPAPGGSETILVAEDEELVRRLAERVLGDAGYRVLPARDGDEAVRLFHQHADRIHLALLDVVMPKRSGPAVCRAIRSRRPALPVLFSSGHTANHLPPATGSQPAPDVIAKPYTPDELLRRVRQVLDAPARRAPRA